MGLETVLGLYIILLAITIILVIMKKTHWFSMIGVALLPLYFFWVLLDLRRTVVEEAELLSQNEETNGN